MPSSLIVLLLLASVSFAPSGPQHSDERLPQLNVIRTATLSPSYSCHGSYRGSALFFTKYGSQYGTPDLLFNGACGAPDYFEASTAGDDMALIGDLGPGISLETVTPHRAFNSALVADPAAETRFTNTARVVAGHVYVVLLNKSDVRGLFVFAVTEHEPHRSVALRYVVKSYDVLTVAARAEGFGWEKVSVEEAARR